MTNAVPDNRAQVPIPARAGLTAGIPLLTLATWYLVMRVGGSLASVELIVGGSAGPLAAYYLVYVLQWIAAAAALALVAAVLAQWPHTGRVAVAWCWALGAMDLGGLLAFGTPFVCFAALAPIFLGANIAGYLRRFARERSN